MQTARLNREEFWNTVTHALGMLLSLLGLIVLMYRSVQTGDPRIIFALGIFAMSMILLYSASTFYHWVRDESRKKVLQKLDHVAIYILISGTYTPFALLLFESGTGYRILATVWGIAAIGLIYKIWFFERWPNFSLFLYLAMGWLIVFDIREFLQIFPIQGVLWLIGGGLLYTAGTYFFCKGSQAFASCNLAFICIGWDRLPFCGGLGYLI
ncbi:MAG: hemolysin III family protein [Saprospiraceae bacterium]|nr:hemolysin III family protein [Saprospiraceae bacterium]